jgi:uncharacterized protein
MKVLYAFATILFLGLLASPASAASFDCAKAGNATEKAICADPAVSRLDEQVAGAFRTALALWPAGNWGAYLRAEQLGWLADRNRICKADKACLKQDYTRRLAYLTHPNLKWQGRYVQGECPNEGLYADVTQNYPDTGVSVDIYACPSPGGNMLLQAKGTPDAAGKLVYVEAGCRHELTFAQDTVSVTSAPAPGGKCYFSGTYAGTYARNPRKSPFVGE